MSGNEIIHTPRLLTLPKSSLEADFPPHRKTWRTREGIRLLTLFKVHLYRHFMVGNLFIGAIVSMAVWCMHT